MWTACLAARSLALTRSACSEAVLTPVPVGPDGMDLSEQVAVAVQEGAVDVGGSGDRRETNLGIRSRRGIDGFDETLASAGRVRTSTFDHDLLGCCRGGHAERSGRRSGRSWRTRGRPRFTIAPRLRRTDATALSTYQQRTKKLLGDLNLRPSHAPTPADPGPAPSRTSHSGPVRTARHATPHTIRGKRRIAANQHSTIHRGTDLVRPLAHRSHTIHIVVSIMQNMDIMPTSEIAKARVTCGVTRTSRCRADRI